MSVRPRARVYEVGEEEKELSSKDLTRKQLVLYILNDFIRGFYLIACLFLDGLVVLQFYSFDPGNYLHRGIFSTDYVRYGYVGFATISLEVLVIYVQYKGYRRFWPKGALFLGQKKEMQKNEDQK